MGEKAKYSWTVIFDEVKAAYPLEGIVLVKSKRKYVDPFTPRTISGMAHMYARYDHELDSVEVWAFTGKSEDIIDPEDGDWGRWSMKEKIVGRRNRDGEWVEPLRSVLMPDQG